MGKYKFSLLLLSIKYTELQRPVFSNKNNNYDGKSGCLDMFLASNDYRHWQFLFLFLIICYLVILFCLLFLFVDNNQLCHWAGNEVMPTYSNN